MKKSWGLIVIVLLVLLGTVYFVFTVPPEERVVWSDDEMVRLEYVAESGTYLEITEDNTLKGVTPVYTVEPIHYIFVTPATLVFNVAEVTDPIDQLFIGELNPETSEWQILPTEYSRERNELSTQVDRVAQWALIYYNASDLDN